MSKVRILIIDSGVRVDHPHLKNDGIQGLTWDGGEMDSGIDDDFGHGTAVYGIIRSVNSFAEIINIRLKDIEEGIDYQGKVLHFLLLIDIFQPCIQNQDYTISGRCL